jgi:hypothetical protein
MGSLALASVSIAIAGAGVAAPMMAVSATPECRSSDVDEARRRFKELFQAGRYREAFDTLASVQRCAWVLRDEDQGWMRSDLALAARKIGDDARCLATLGDYPRGDPSTKLGKAVLFNYGLCGGECQPWGLPESLPCYSGRSARFAHLTSPIAARLVLPGVDQTWVSVPQPGYFPAILQLFSSRQPGSALDGYSAGTGNTLPGGTPLLRDPAATGGGTARVTGLSASRVQGRYRAPGPGAPADKEFDAALCTVDVVHPDAAPAAAAVPEWRDNITLHLTVKTGDGCTVYMRLTRGGDDPHLSPGEYTRNELLQAILYPGPRCPDVPNQGVSPTTELRPGPYVEPGPHLVLERTSPDLRGSYDIRFQGGRHASGRFEMPLCDLAGMTYAKPAAQLPRPESKGPCSRKAIEALGSEIDALLNEHAPERAYQRALEVKERCGAALVPAQQLALALLLGRAAHAAGDDRRCRLALEAAPRDLADSDEDAGHLEGLCGAGCNIHGQPGCLEGRSERYQAELEAAHETGFGTPPCSIPGRRGAIGIAARGGAKAACVELVDAKSEALEEPDPKTGMSSRWTCPRLRFVVLDPQGKLAMREMPLPGRGSGPDDCCNFTTLTVKEEGGATWLRIESDGLSRNCFGGTATWTYDEIFRWDGRQLTLERVHDFGWH